MPLLNTLILPTDDAALSCELLRKLIFEQPHIVMVAFDATQDAQDLVTLADRVVSQQRLVLALAWARDRNQVGPVIGDLKAKPDSLLADVPNARAITLSQGDVIKDVIKAAEPKPDMVRIFKAFSAGAKP